MNVCQTGVGVRGAACVRAIDANLSCQVTNDRMKAMAKTPDSITVRVNVEPNPRPACGGPSLLELLWERLMASYAELMEVDWDNPVDDEIRLQGHTLGLAEAISIIVNPYAPDVDAVRAEAADRYEDIGALHNDGLEA